MTSILFYSNHCHHCKQLLQLVQSSQLSSQLKQICIDNIPRHRIPASVKSVPTVVVSGSLTTLVGQEAFKWIQEQVQKEKAASANNASPQGGPGGGSGGGPDGYMNLEMGNAFSDSYSFIGNDSVIPKNFSFLSDKDAAGANVKSNPFEQSSMQTSDSANTQQLDKRMQQAMMERGTSGGGMGPGHGMGQPGGGVMSQNPQINPPLSGTLPSFQPQNGDLPQMQMSDRNTHFNPTNCQMASPIQQRGSQFDQQMEDLRLARERDMPSHGGTRM